MRPSPAKSGISTKFSKLSFGTSCILTEFSLILGISSQNPIFNIELALWNLPACKTITHLFNFHLIL